MSDHSFNPFIAQKYNINVAILLNSFVFWTRTNAAKSKNFHDGRYWCFGTPEYFKNYFPYFTYDQIRRTIEKCVENGLLMKGNFNQKGYDRTNWYSLTEKALSEYNLDITCLKPASDTIRQNCQMDLAELPNAFGNFAQPIPVNKTKIINTSKICVHTLSKNMFTLPDLLQDNPFSVPEQMLEDWLTTRHKMKIPITKTAWSRLNSELAKCVNYNVAPLDAFEEMVSSGWRSLKAEWFGERRAKNKVVELKPKIDMLDYLRGVR